MNLRTSPNFLPILETTLRLSEEYRRQKSHGNWLSRAPEVMNCPLPGCWAIFLGLISLIVSCAICPWAVAQQEVALKQTFVPSFSIEPLVARISGRRGDVVQFSFKIRTAKPDANVEIKLVGLRQDITGQVHHDERNANQDTIQLLNGGNITLEQDTPFQLEGMVKVPPGDANFHSWGVLVRDLGRARDRTSQVDEQGKEKTSAGINFVTQYLLRVDLDVEGARGEHERALSLDDVQVAVKDGLPQLVALVRNPSQTAFEFELKSQLKQHEGDRSFAQNRLVMPVRESSEGPERFVGRVLPQSQLMMRGLIHEPLMSGTYLAELQMLVGGKTVSKKQFTVTVDSADFPAQEAIIKQMPGGIYITPPQFELSQNRGGQRRVSVEIKNNSSEPKNISLSAAGANQAPLPLVSISPTEFSLSPGRSRKLSISLKSTKEVAQAIQYGEITVHATGAGGYAQTGQLPVALLLAATPTPELRLDQLRWIPKDNYPCFRIQVNNSGQIHQPLHARLIIMAESGTRTTVPAGFGKWLMPGQTTDLEFRLDRPLPPGKYSITTELQRGEQLIQQKGVYEITDYDNATAAR